MSRSMFDQVFRPTQGEIEARNNLIKRLYEEEVVKKGCLACTHCHHVRRYPDYVTGEEYDCEAGLECDTILDTVKDCPSWEKQDIKEWAGW